MNEFVKNILLNLSTIFGKADATDAELDAALQARKDELSAKTDAEKLAEIETLKADLKTAQDEKANAESALALALSEKETAENKTNFLESEVERLETEITESAQANKTVEGLLADAKTQIETLSADLAATRVELVSGKTPQEKTKASGFEGGKEKKKGGPVVIKSPELKSMLH